MGKSIRSKRKKRLRTLKREISAAHYDKKDEAKMAVLDAILAAPKPDNSGGAMDIEVAAAVPAESSRGRSAMDIEGDKPEDEGLYYGVSLKSKSKISKKRGKSKRGKSKHRRQKKLNF